MIHFDSDGEPVPQDSILLHQALDLASEFPIRTGVQVE
jgi:hypothetical protein